MNTIEKIYTNYDGLLEEFSEEVIQSRYAVFYEEIEEFAKSLGIREKIQISESLLSHAVLDYFTDISRLKHFHQAKHINSLKFCLESKQLFLNLDGNLDFFCMIIRKPQLHRSPSFYQICPVNTNRNSTAGSCMPCMEHPFSFA